MIVKLNEQNYADKGRAKGYSQEEIQKRFDKQMASNRKWSNDGYKRAKKDELKENRETQDIREWYLATYPTDEVGEELVQGKTFEELFNFLDRRKGSKIYEFLFGDNSLGDSLVRERIFQKLSEISGVPYGEIYDQWLLGESKKKVTRTKKQLKESLKKLTSEMDIEIKDKDLIKEIETHLGYSKLDGRDIQEIKDAKIIFNSETYNDGVYFQLDLKFNAYLKDFDDNGRNEWKEFKIIDGPAYSGWYEQTDEEDEVYYDVEMEQQIQQHYYNEGLRIISEVIDTLGLQESIYYEMDELVRENVDEPNNLEEQLKLNKLVENELGEKPLKVILEKVGSTSIVKATLKDNTSINYVLLGEDLFTL